MANQVKKSISPNRVILILVDFSAMAENAMVYGFELAQILDFRVCLLHVYVTPPDTIYNKEDAAYQNACQKLQECKERLTQKYAVGVDLLIREGNLFKVINRVSAEIKPAILVMGTHGKQGLQHLFGSYALRVVLDAACPVLVVQDNPYAGFRRFVLPVNSDLDPRRLIDWVLYMCTFSDPEISLFQAAEVNPDMNILLKKITSQISGALKEKNVSCTISIAGSPNDFLNQVINHAAATRSDLVMTMTMPAGELTGHHFSDWNERLMFNPGRVPVMFIDRAEPAG
ncbi:MAG: universal stress protein [Bacteroidetes bacterium]|nr:universal stress protein [Bacteroidota bacterium]